MDFNSDFQEYKRILEHLDREMLKDDDTEIIAAMKRRLRNGFFRRWSEKILTYFYPYDRTFGHLEDCEMFLYENNTKAIRKFHGYWYTVDVTAMDSVAITTRGPDDYPFHVLPSQGQDYPEYIIADYIQRKMEAI